MSELKREWFQPGPDGESPFVKAALQTPEEMPAWETIAAAFRALLAEDEQQSQCGKAVQVPEAVSSNVAEFIRSKDDEITGLRAEVERLTAELRACADERMAAEIERDAADEFVERMIAERDALQARIDAGVRVWDKWKQECGKLWLLAFPGATASQAWSDVCDALDAQPLDHITDAGKIVDDRRRTPGTRADRRSS